MNLLDRSEEVGMRRRLSPRTIECYQRWVRAFLIYAAERPVPEAAEGDPFDIPLIEDDPPGERRWRHPRELEAAEVEAFLTSLAKDRKLSASSQNQATM